MAGQRSDRSWFAMLRPDYVSACPDPSAAPGRHHGPDAAPPFTLRRAVQNMVWVYGFGLIFLAFAVAALRTGDPTPAVLAVRVVLVLVLAAAYLGTAWVADCSLRLRWLYLSGFVAVLLAGGPVWGWGLVGYGVYVAIMMATLLPWRQSRIAIVVWSGLVAVTIPLGSGDTAPYTALISLGMGLATAAAMEAGAARARLAQAEQRVSTLSVAAERERISRDLHDILGHSLTAISIKADLAARLVDVDPAAARTQIGEIEQVARQALADVRTTASGMRQVRVATEIASGRSVLLAAGIESRLPTALPRLPDRVSELFGYAVREGITNVVRHSRAGLCTIVVEPGSVEVRDDGVGVGDRADRGSGLSGLRERASQHGGSLSIEHPAGGGTVLRVELAPEQLAAEPAAATQAATRRMGAGEAGDGATTEDAVDEAVSR